MVMGQSKAALVLSPAQREQLECMASSRSLPAGQVSRVRIILMSASGKTNQQIAGQLRLANATAGKWRRRDQRLKLALAFQHRNLIGDDPHLFAPILRRHQAADDAIQPNALQRQRCVARIFGRGQEQPSLAGLRPFKRTPHTLAFFRKISGRNYLTL